MPKTRTSRQPLARDCKKSLDELLLSYKKKHEDLRYIIQKGPSDLKVLIKRVLELNHVPYRELDVLSLGDISPLKPKAEKPEEGKEEVEENEVDEAGFIKPKIRKGTLWKAKCSERNKVFENITSFLNGFTVIGN